MTGAGGLIAANHLYNRVKPDGLTIGAWASPLVLQHIMGNEAAQFDGRKFGYLGIPSPYDTVCTFNQQSGITKMDDWINAKRPQKISAIGPGTSTSDIPKLLKAALNLPMDVIDGYKGGADARLGGRVGRSRRLLRLLGHGGNGLAQRLRKQKNPSGSAGVAQVASQVQTIFRSRSTTPRPKKRASCSESPTTRMARNFLSPCRRGWPKIALSFCSEHSFEL